MQRLWTLVVPKATTSYENPLIPHARMRALYRALVELRLLRDHLPKGERVPKGLEACWAATALDLREGDLTSDAGADALPGYLRDIATRTGSGAPRAGALESLTAATSKPFAGSATDRLLCAIGAAMALKSADNKAVAVAYARQGELDAADWKRILRVAAVGDLPLVVVAAAADELPVSSRMVPVIPVDAADAVAIYRVTQESLVRARAEGGVVVIECVKTGLDPVKVLAGQLHAKGIATPAWTAAVETRMRALLSAE